MSELILPTAEEISDAEDEIVSRGPVPLANLVDNTPTLREYVKRLAQLYSLKSGTSDLYTWMKSAYSAGLHMGIVIGEGRHSVNLRAIREAFIAGQEDAARQALAILDRKGDNANS